MGFFSFLHKGKGKGAATGATQGAIAGSSFGPWGAGIGGTIGAITGYMGAKKDGRLSSKEKHNLKKYGTAQKPYKIDTMDKYQKAMYQDWRKSIYGKGPLGDLFKTQEFDPQAANANFDASVARPAYRNFQENIVPGITGQFRSGGLQDSSYVAGALGNAGRDVQESLDAQRANYIYNQQQQAEQNKLNMQLQRQAAMKKNLDRSTFAYVRPGYSGNQIQQSQGPSTTSTLFKNFGPVAADWLSNYLTSRGGSGSTSNQIFF